MPTIQIKEYTTIEESHFSKADAQVIGPVLNSLSERGEITARDVVDAAHSSNSPIHAYFEWDDKVAADKYRVGQAQHMLRSIRVRYIDEAGQPRERKFVSIVHGSANEPRRYERFDVLNDQSAFAARMIFNALEDLQGWKRKYEGHIQTWDKFKKLFGPMLNNIESMAKTVTDTSAPIALDDALKALRSWYEQHSGAMRSWKDASLEVDDILGSILTIEKDFARETGIKERKCLKCQEAFMSFHAGERLCDRHRKAA